MTEAPPFLGLRRPQIGATELATMGSDGSQNELTARTAAQFATTHWSTVLAAGDSASPDSKEALEKLCRQYWYPLYAYIRRRGFSAEDAEDLVQSFFERLLEKSFLKSVLRERGRFRGFLLSALRHFLANEWDRTRTIKRGGGVRLISLDEHAAEGRFLAEPSLAETPDQAFERSWARSVLDHALRRLEAQWRAAGRERQFNVLTEFLSSPAEEGAYATVAARLGTTPHAIANSVLRLRQAYGRAVRAEVAQTVATAAEVDAEIRYLVHLLTDEGGVGLDGTQDPLRDR